MELNKGLVVLSRGLVGFRYAEEPLVQDVACDVRSVQLTTRRMLRYMADVKVHGGC